MADDDLTTRISTAAAGPKKASGDIGAFEEQSLTDLVEAGKYTAAKAATQNTTSPRLMVNRISPPGATG